MNAGKLRAAAALFFLIALITVSVPVPALADGGPAVHYELWEYLKEGHQVAVVTILNQDYARIDLFISILDRTEQSHEIVFFVPLGTGISDFKVVEKRLAYFDEQATRYLDRIIRDSATRKQRAVQILFSGALLTNGALLVPLWAPVLLTGCAEAEPKPDVILQKEDTNLESLIRTTGLAPAVADTLSRLQGQQIAVVRMQTRPQEGMETGNGSGGTLSEPGLHLSWKTALIAGASGPAYSYPLGTGAAWSKPIELTRVYVVAPRDLDFDVQYPKLGSERSGYDIIEGAYISRNFQIPSYAIDEARGDFGRVWRATYTQSNSADDIIVTAKPQSTYSRFLASAEESATATSFIFAFFIGLAVWVLAWYFLMPRFLGAGLERPTSINWYEALIYPGINLFFMFIPGAVFYLFFLFGMYLPSLGGVFLIPGLAVIGFFTSIHGKKLGVRRSRAVGAFVLTSLCGSAAYLVLALAFAKIINVI